MAPAITAGLFDRKRGEVRPLSCCAGTALAGPDPANRNTLKAADAAKASSFASLIGR